MRLPPELRDLVCRHLDADLRALLSLGDTYRDIGEQVSAAYPVPALQHAMRLLERAIRLDPGALGRFPHLSKLRTYLSPAQAAGLAPPEGNQEDVNRLRQQLAEPRDRSRERFEAWGLDAVRGLATEELQQLVALLPAFASAQGSRVNREAIGSQAFDVMTVLVEMTAEQFKPHADHFQANGAELLDDLEGIDTLFHLNAPGHSDDLSYLLRGLAGRMPNLSFSAAVQDTWNTAAGDRHIHLEGLARAIAGLTDEQCKQEAPEIGRVVDMWLNAPRRVGHEPVDFSGVFARLTAEQFQPVIDRFFAQEAATPRVKAIRRQVVAHMDRMSDAQFDHLAALLAPVEHVQPPYYHGTTLLDLSQALAGMSRKQLGDRREPLYRMVDTVGKIAWDTGDLDFVRSYAESVAELAQARIKPPQDPV